MTPSRLHCRLAEAAHRADFGIQAGIGVSYGCGTLRRTRSAQQNGFTPVAPLPDPGQVGDAGISDGRGASLDHRPDHIEVRRRPLGHAHQAQPLFLQKGGHHPGVMLYLLRINRQKRIGHGFNSRLFSSKEMASSG